MCIRRPVATLAVLIWMPWSWLPGVPVKPVVSVEGPARSLRQRASGSGVDLEHPALRRSVFMVDPSTPEFDDLAKLEVASFPDALYDQSVKG